LYKGNKKILRVQDFFGCWLLAISYWLAFGNPSQLRLGNISCGVSLLTQNREFNEVKEVSELQ